MKMENYMNSNNCYMYYLFKDDIIVYIGTTTDIHRRINSHAKEKDFDIYIYIKIENKDRNEIEAFHILENDPPYNRVLPKNERYINVNRLLFENIKKDDFIRETLEFGLKAYSFKRTTRSGFNINVDYVDTWAGATIEDEDRIYPMKIVI